ncbi:MAG: helix-turn-helix domain-containing protein [Treponema sp.]|nr:helix-turn-helix domain-containing protein [Treponema sp.]
METYLTVKDVADLLQLSVQTIRRYTMNKEIPFYKINRTVRYKKSEIEDWFEIRKAAKNARNQKQNKPENMKDGLFGKTESGVTQ